MLPHTSATRLCLMEALYLHSHRPPLRSPAPLALLQSPSLVLITAISKLLSPLHFVYYMHLNEEWIEYILLSALCSVIKYLKALKHYSLFC